MMHSRLPPLTGLISPPENNNSMPLTRTRSYAMPHDLTQIKLIRPRRLAYDQKWGAGTNHIYYVTNHAN